MPDPFKRRKRQPRGRISKRKVADSTAKPSAAATDDKEAPRDGRGQVEANGQGVSSGEYRPL